MSQQAHCGTLASQAHVLCNNVRSSEEAKEVPVIASTLASRQ